MTQEAIKADATDLFNKGDYPAAYQKLWELGSDSFFRYLFKSEERQKKWLYNAASASFFWEHHILAQDVYEEVFNSEFAPDILHIYFSKYKHPSEQLISRLALSHPHLLIRAIRLNRVFLKKDWLPLLLKLKLEEDLSVHSKIWQLIHDHEVKLWTSVESNLSGVNEFSIEELFAETIIWLEIRRFKAQNTKHTIHFLGRIYSLFIEKVLPSIPRTRDIKEIKEDKIFKLICDRAVKMVQLNVSDDQSGTAKLLDAIGNWLRFYEEGITPYSFYLEIIPIERNKEIFYSSTPQDHYRWLIDGTRYEINQLLYHIIGSEISDDLEQTGYLTIPKGKMPWDETGNRNISARKLGTLALLDSLRITNLKAGQFAPVDQVLGALLAYSANRQDRYERSLHETSSTSRSWAEAFIKLMHEAIKVDITKEPYVLHTKEEYVQLNKRAVQLPEECSNLILQFFAYSFGGRIDTDRFRSRYDVYQKPFLVIGNQVFCPTIFWGTNIWFYSFVQEALLLRKGTSGYKEETTCMENYLGDKLKSKRWFVKVVNDEEAKLVKGDADIIVADGRYCLLIQLKRTYLRLNLEDSYNESLMIDRHAARQLRDAEQYFTSSNPVYETNLPVIRWIVSTSFENINCDVSGCTKVNYFELLNALNNIEINSLEDLAKNIKNETTLKAIYNAGCNPAAPEDLLTITKELGLPLPLFESKHYMKSIFILDGHVVTEYNSTFNIGLKLNEKQAHTKSIKALEICTVLNEDDGEAWGALANVYADTKDWNNAARCFEKASILLPDDPWVMRNYAFALMESGQLVKGMNILMDLYEKYPLLGVTMMEIEGQLEYFTLMNFLSLKEISLLKARWTSLSGSK